MENLVVPILSGIEKLADLGWNFTAQDMNLIMGAGRIALIPGHFSRWINAFFFDSSDECLVTRHIKWIDFFPTVYDDSNSEVDTFSVNVSVLGPKLLSLDLAYRYPLPHDEDFKYKKLPLINRFIELWSSGASEPDVTKFLEDPAHKFILTMNFGAVEARAQLRGEWQSQDRAAIIPDFLIVRPDGYADILEFKLPKLKTHAAVGRANREAFSAELTSYVAQTRVYAEYFEDPNNRKWFEATHGVKVHRPKRIIVAGRRSMFPEEVWRDIVADFRDLQLLTYDDVVDGVTAQFYM